MIAYIAIGSNQQDPANQLHLAELAINKIKETTLLVASSLYCSQPMGPQDQPDYMNCVVKIDTLLTAIELLDELQLIEQSQGRVRKKERWGPRTLDLDIILYNNETIQTERLTIPHYGMRSREFVLYPLYEIDPQLILPDGTLLSQLLIRCDKNNLIKFCDKYHNDSHFN